MQRGKKNGAFHLQIMKNVLVEYVILKNAYQVYVTAIQKGKDIWQTYLYYFRFKKQLTPHTIWSLLRIFAMHVCNHSGLLRPNKKVCFR